MVEPKSTTFGPFARSKIIEGINLVADAVRVTMGPGGRNVVIERSFGSEPLVTKDGVTVAKHIFASDRLVNAGAQMCKAVSAKAADVAGDGTTTATVLAQALVKYGIEAQTANPNLNLVAFKRGIDSAVETYASFVSSMAADCSDLDSLVSVATVSANADSVIGEMVGHVVHRVGEHGAVTLFEAGTDKDSFEIIEGMTFDQGLFNPVFATNRNTGKFEAEDAMIVIVDHPVQNIHQIASAIESIGKAGKPCVIIAESFSPEVVRILAQNVLQGNFTCALVHSPGYGVWRTPLLDDIALYTGAQLVANTSIKIGMVARVVVGDRNTSLIGPTGDELQIQERVEFLKDRVLNSDSPEDARFDQQRLNRFTCGVAAIYVAGATEVELKERKDRFDDAVHAALAALDGGTVAGGGSALLYASQYANPVESASADINLGIEAVKKAIFAPFKQIVKNVGISDADEVVKEVLDTNYYGIGYDAASGKVCNLLELGIVDPAVVTVSALRAAASIAGLALTTEVAITFNKEVDTE